LVNLAAEWERDLVQSVQNVREAPNRVIVLALKPAEGIARVIGFRLATTPRSAPRRHQLARPCLRSHAQPDNTDTRAKLQCAQPPQLGFGSFNVTANNLRCGRTIVDQHYASFAFGRLSGKERPRFCCANRKKYNGVR